MTDKQQTEAFTGELMAVVDRFRAEWNISTAAAVGALEIVKHSILKQAFDEVDEDDDDA